MIEVQVSKMVLKICYKFSSIYLKIKSIVARITTVEKFVPGDVIDWLENLIFNSKNGKELEGGIKIYSLWERLQFWVQTILKLISLKILLFK